eukprot:gene5761-6669_t
MGEAAIKHERVHWITTVTPPMLLFETIVDDSKEDGHASAAAAAVPAPKKKVSSKDKPQVVIDLNNRNKRKYVTSIQGLDGFGIKLADAQKIMSKKFSCGCSVVKSAAGPDEIVIQGDFQMEAIDLILANWGTVVPHEDIYIIQDKKKIRAPK